MHLFLMRHGEALREDGGPEPVLTGDGRAGVLRVADFLARGRHRPEEILTSDRLRARQTGELVAETLADGVEVQETSGVTPHDPPEGLDALLACRAGNLLIVSHLPFLDRLAGRLLTGREAGGFDIPPGGLLCLLRYPEAKSGTVIPPRFLLRWMVTPGILPAVTG
jgi:phosphohistidine phosphatase